MSQSTEETARSGPVGPSGTGGLNVVLLHSHNSGRHIRPYGHAVPTPHLQRLAEEGVLFRHAYAGAPTCSPSRACLMTGQWAHTNGMLGLAHRGFSLHDYGRTLIRHFNQAGYHTVRCGLQHIAPFESPQVIGYRQEFDLPSEYGKDVADAAVAFLERRPRDRPFFLDAGVKETHTPFPPPTTDDDPRYLLPPSPLPDTPETRRDTAGFCASARRMDDAFGAILDALDRHGLRDQTLVVCLTDHGLQLPLNMCNLTDRGIGTFMIMRGPGGFSGGRVCEHLISHIDLFPTLCDAVGLVTPDWVQGRSFHPSSDGQVPGINKAVFAEVTFHAAYEPQRCVRTSRWKYIRRFDQRETVVLPNIDEIASRTLLLDAGLRDQPRWQEGLFDLKLDPNECRNVAHEPRVAEVLTEMRGRLRRWMETTDDPILQGPVIPPIGAQYNDPDAITWKEEPLTYDGG